MKNLLECHGIKFTATKNGFSTEGVISIENGNAYLCTNNMNGSSCKNKFGYTYSFVVGTGSPEELDRWGISNFKLLNFVDNDFYEGSIIVNGKTEAIIIKSYGDFHQYELNGQISTFTLKEDLTKAGWKPKKQNETKAA